MIKQVKILLVEGKSLEVDLENLTKIFYESHETFNLNYSDFDDKGFCVCKEASIIHYLNDCPYVLISSKEVKMFVTVIFIAVLTLTLCVKGFYIAKEFFRSDDAVQEVQLQQNHHIIQVQ